MALSIITAPLGTPWARTGLAGSRVIVNSLENPARGLAISVLRVERIDYQLVRVPYPGWQWHFHHDGSKPHE